MMKIVYIIFVFEINDLEICLGNSNLLFRKKIILLGSLIQKYKTGKQMASYKY